MKQRGSNRTPFLIFWSSSVVLALTQTIIHRCRRSCFPPLRRPVDFAASSPCPSVSVPAGVPPPVASPYAHGSLLQHATHAVLPQKPQDQRQQRVYPQDRGLGGGEGEDAGVSFEEGEQGRQG